MERVTLLMIFAILFTACPNDDEMSLDCDDPIGNEELIYQYFNQSSPSVSPQPVQTKGSVFFEMATAVVSGNDAIITIPGIRVRTEGQNFEIISFQIDEDDNNDGCFNLQSEFDQSSSDVQTKIASVLVLDMSTSLEDNIPQLKEYAKEYANTVVSSSENSTVAIVFFSDRDAITSTNFFTSANIGDLETLIDDFSDFQPRTALYEATQVAIDLLNSFDFPGEKSLVAFTDGGDNDSNNPSQLITQIQESDINRFAIGLDGEDFREENLANVTSTNSNILIANDETALEEVFRKVGRGVISVYEINYNRSNQILTADEKIRIRISMEAIPIE